jgi:hypothetical protein
MKKILLFLLFSITLNVFAQTSLDEVVYLKNGSIIRGVIIEQVLNEKIKIQTYDGNVFVFMYDEIEKITKEPKPTINTNAYKNLAEEANQHKTKGIACVLIGTSFFATGMPLMIRGGRYGLLGRFIPGTILVGVSAPLIIAGPIQLGKYSKLKKEAGEQTGLFISPSIVFYDDKSLSPSKDSKNISVGATLSFKF